MYTIHDESTHSLDGVYLFSIALFLLVGCSQQTASKPPDVTVPQKVATAQNPPPSAPSKPAQVSSLEALQKGTLGKGAGEGPLRDLSFDFDRSDLSPAARDILKGHAVWLKANSLTRIQIEGHCDEHGTSEYNLALGAKRAETVKRYLIDLGTSPATLTTISYGEELSLCKEQNEACWAKNRRAHFVVKAAATT